MNSRVPHAHTVIAFCVVAIAGYAVFSGWAVFYSGDAALRGDVVGTWKSFAVAAFAFWIGSSSGGKASANPDEPQSVTVKQPPDDPIPTTDIPSPEFGAKP